jgi:hypothetical protein
MLILTPQLAFSWGKTGHRIVGEIAQAHLSPRAQKKITKILKHEGLAHISNWPDFIRSDNKISAKYKTWHYVNIPKGKKYEVSQKNKKGDLITAIEYFRKKLTSKTTSIKERKESLSFLVHLLGDLHQPLHTGFATDRGGNSISLKWFGEPTNLHRVWDENIISSEKLSYTEYSKKLNHKGITLAKIKNWQKGTPITWMYESRSLLSEIYKFEKNKYWEYKYMYVHIKTLDQQLLLAGLRLAQVLNNIYQ